MESFHRASHDPTFRGCVIPLRPPRAALDRRGAARARRGSGEGARHRHRDDEGSSQRDGARERRRLRRIAIEEYHGAEIVYGWSFYTQGNSGASPSADQFIDTALEWFGDPDPRLGTEWEKG